MLGRQNRSKVRDIKQKRQGRYYVECTITVKPTKFKCSEKAIQSFHHQQSFYSTLSMACDFSMTFQLVTLPIIRQLRKRALR